MDQTAVRSQPAARETGVSAARRVAEGVIEALELGRFAPGQRLVEADLCLRFGVGRNAVREALQRLASEGLIELSRHKGATIREISPEQALQTLELTELLAGLTARAAARGVEAPGATALVRQAMQRIEEAQAHFDDGPFVKARSAYWGAMLRIGGNDELRRIFPSVQVHVLRAQYHLTRVHRTLHDDFHAIGEAVLAGDPGRAERTARRHVRRIRTTVAAELTLQENDHG